MLFVVVMAVLTAIEIVQGNVVMATAFGALAVAALMPVLEARARGRVESGLWGPKLTGHRGTISVLAIALAFGLVGYHAITH